MPGAYDRPSDVGAEAGAGALVTSAALLWIAVLLAGAAFGGLWTVRYFLSETGWSGQPGSFTVSACQVSDNGDDGESVECSGRYVSDDGRTVVDPAYYEDGRLTSGATYDVLRGLDNDMYVPNGPQAVISAAPTLLLIMLVGLGIQAVGWTLGEFDALVDPVGTWVFLIGLIPLAPDLLISFVWWLVDAI
jgi:hypothetical protein